MYVNFKDPFYKTTEAKYKKIILFISFYNINKIYHSSELFKFTSYIRV